MGRSGYEVSDVEGLGVLGCWEKGFSWRPSTLGSLFGWVLLTCRLSCVTLSQKIHSQHFESASPVDSQTACAGALLGLAVRSPIGCRRRFLDVARDASWKFSRSCTSMTSSIHMMSANFHDECKRINIHRCCWPNDRGLICQASEHSSGVCSRVL